MKNEDRIKSILLKLFSMVFIATFIYISYIAVFHSDERSIKMNSIINLIGGIVLFIILYFINRKLRRVQDKTLRIIRVITFIIIILLQISFIKFFLLEPSWDYGAVTSNAIAFARGTDILPTYFYELYPNNIGITLLLGYIFKVVGLFTDSYSIYMSVGFLVNIIMINLSIYIVYKFINKIYGTARGTLFCIFTLLVTPLYTYSQIIYTDTMTMVFPIAMFYLLYNYYNREKKRYIELIFIGILGGIGTVLKTNIVIALMAIAIYILFKEKLLKGIVSVVIIIIPFISLMGEFKVIAQNHIPIAYEEAGLPYTHWIMMGLKGNGSYNADDLIFTNEVRAEKGKEGAKKVNIEIIKDRLNEYGLVGYLKFLDGKISFTWGDGTYYATSKLSRLLLTENKIQQYIIGNKNTVFIYFSQFSHIIILVLILIAGIKSYKNPKEFINGMNICIFGVFLFLILWETRSRYLVCYLPVMMFIAFYGLDFIFNKIDKRIIR